MRERDIVATCNDQNHEEHEMIALIATQYLPRRVRDTDLQKRGGHRHLKFSLDGLRDGFPITALEDVILLASAVN